MAGSAFCRVHRPDLPRPAAGRKARVRQKEDAGAYYSVLRDEELFGLCLDLVDPNPVEQAMLLDVLIARVIRNGEKSGGSVEKVSGALRSRRSLGGAVGRRVARALAVALDQAARSVETR